MAPNWLQAKLIAETESAVLLTEAALQEIDVLAAGLDAGTLSLVRERRAVLEHAMRAGVPAAFATAFQLPPVEGAPERPVMILQRASTSEEMQRLLAEQPVLRNVLEHLAILQSMLGNLRDGLPRTERLRVLQSALAVAWRDWDPSLWRNLLWDLAETTLEGARSEREMQAGIEIGAMALAEGTPEPGGAQRAADLERNMGLAYGASHSGDRAENLDWAIEYLQRAAEGMREAGTPELWAMFEMELGRAWVERIQGDPEDNFAQTVRHLTAAMEVLTRRKWPIAWATCQMVIGTAYFRRRSDDKSADLERAIEHFNRALEILTREDSPEMWATAMLDSASAYVHRDHGDHAANLEEAIKRYELAETVVTRDTDPTNWATLQHNLGLAWDRRINGAREDNAAEAIRHFARALEVRTSDAQPAQRLDTLAAVGHLHFRDRRWAKAVDAYTEALVSVEDTVAVARSLPGRRTRIPQLTLLSTRMAFCLLELGRADEAFARLEGGKTLLLFAERAMMDLGPGRMILGEPATPAPWPLARMLACVPVGGALVAPVVTHRGGRAFVIRHGQRELGEGDIIQLPGLDADVLQTLLVGDSNHPGWLDYQRALSSGPASPHLERWGEQVEGFLRRLWDVMMGAIHDRLSKLGLAAGAPILLLPHGGLGVLPLHAASDGRHCFLDAYTVAQAPSLDTLGPSPARATAPALVVADPTGSLQYAALEANAVAQVLGVRDPLRGHKATVEAVLNRARDAAIVHLACHGRYDWNDPLDSALLLSRELLTWRRIVADLELRAAPLATLSACETGVSDALEMPDEVIGLAGGFLMAGASGVLSSLWAVDDAATSLLMQRFYARLLTDEESPASALRDAQRWLRDAPRAELADAFRDLADQSPAARSACQALLLGGAPDSRPYANPFYWAAWTFTGAA
jgi:tetratricopeptide (TPR) repeat protein